MKAIDLTGQRFDRLLVIDGPFIKRPYGKAQRNWLCKCDCGKWRLASTPALRHNNTKSCGCKRADTCKQLGKSSAPKLPKGESGFRALFRSYYRKAKERNYCFELSEEVFRNLTRSNCHYCGIEPQRKWYGSAKTAETKEHTAYTYNGIDRKDPTVGYVDENCVPSCRDCNLAKQSLGYNKFIELIKRISKEHK